MEERDGWRNTRGNRAEIWRDAVSTGQRGKQEGGDTHESKQMEGFLVWVVDFPPHMGTFRTVPPTFYSSLQSFHPPASLLHPSSPSAAQD